MLVLDCAYRALVSLRCDLRVPIAVRSFGLRLGEGNWEGQACAGSEAPLRQRSPKTVDLQATVRQAGSGGKRTRVQSGLYETASSARSQRSVSKTSR